MNSILQGDCLEGLRACTQQVDLTVTSPPYFNVKEYVNYDSYQAYLDSLKAVFTEVFRVTKPGRICCVNLSNILLQRKSRSHESSRIPLAFHFVPLMETIGWKFLEDIVWVKPEGSAKNRNGGFFQHRQPIAYKPNVVNEYIFIFQKPSGKLIDAIVRSYDAYTEEVSRIDTSYERTNVWSLNPETRSKHPAPYPESLVERLVRYYSFVGDVVLDPYMGSGTTAVVAKKLHRNWFGYELHAEYIDMAQKRLQAAQVNALPSEISLPSATSVDELRALLKKKSKRFLLHFGVQGKKEEVIDALCAKYSSTH